MREEIIPKLACARTLATDSSFLDLGGTGLKITTKAALVHKNMGEAMSPSMVSKKPTLHGLAEYLASMT
jgi:hypothetical protein